MTDELKKFIQKKLIPISEESVNLESLELASQEDIVFSLLWTELKFDVILEKIKKAKFAKEALYEDVFTRMLSHFKGIEKPYVDHFVFAYLALLSERAGKVLSAMIKEFMNEFFEEIAANDEERKLIEGNDGLIFEDLTSMARASEVAFYNQLEPIYDDVITNLFSEKSHVPIICTPQDKLRNAIYAHIAHRFNNFDAPVILRTSTIYLLNAKSLLSQLLVAPNILMDTIDQDLKKISEMNAGMVIIDEVDTFFDSGENILLRRIYNSCRREGLYLILGSSKKPPFEYWLEPVHVNLDVDVEDCVHGYMRHMVHNYKYTVNEDALSLIKNVSSNLFSKTDFNSTLRLIEKSAAMVSFDAFKPSKAIVEAKRGLDEMVQPDVDLLSKEFQDRVSEAIKNISHHIENQLDGSEAHLTIDVEHVKKALGKFFNIKDEDLEPVGDRVQNLEERLNKEIFGQEKAIKVISESLMRSMSGLFDKKGPIGVYCVLGASGVGKTFTAKVLQKLVYGERELIRIDMGEYLDKTAVNRLLGSSAGYVGYEEGSAFFEAVKKNPRSVVLIDEIEKATPEIADAFLKIFDEGYATDNKGERVDFSQVIFIVTGNIGTKSLQSESKRSMGFVQDEGAVSQEEKLESARKELKTHFKPEFLNRIDEIIYYEPLNDAIIEKILEAKFKVLVKNFKNKEIDISFSQDVIKTLVGKCKDPIHNGARLVNKVFRDNIETPSVKEFFAGNRKIHISQENGVVKF